MLLKTIQGVFLKNSATSRLDRVMRGAALATTVALAEAVLTAGTGTVVGGILDSLNPHLDADAVVAVNMMVAVGAMLTVADVVLVATWIGRRVCRRVGVNRVRAGSMVLTMPKAV